MRLFSIPKDEKINIAMSVPFILMHFLPLLAIFTGVTWFDVGLLFILYAVRMFFITAGYHRYFAHRAYELNRVMQFIMAFGAMTSVQKGVLWWSGLHRHHHLYSDTDRDIHSPKKGFWWSHVGWILCDKYKETPMHLIQDFAKYPEIRWLDRHPMVPPTILGVGVFVLWGPSALLIGFFLSTVLLYHGTFSINSLAHIFGRRRYVTDDTSRNSLFLALITGGEGWHNNHHHYRSAAKQGFFWWEIDTCYYILKLLNLFGLVKNLRVPPKMVLLKNRIKDGYVDVGELKAQLDKALIMVNKAKVQGGKVYEEKLRQLEELALEVKRLSKGMVLKQ